MNMLPDPHPLDFDWRYDAGTRERLEQILAPFGNVICIGAPSVARLMESKSLDVTLLDRQPYQGVKNHIAIDPMGFRPERQYRAALIDPPWYPGYLDNWVQIAAHAVGVQGTIFVSIWPSNTRPWADEEVRRIFNNIGAWGDIERDWAYLAYETPLFEKIAARLSDDELSHSPLQGELVRIVVRDIPTIPVARVSGEEWLRFVFDDYQLALKKSAPEGVMSVDCVPEASGWLWPYVSARAPGRDKIDLWSSEGEVARIRNPKQIANLLRIAGVAKNQSEFERTLGDLPILKEWRIPPPPYRRFAEWSHRQ